MKVTDNNYLTLPAGTHPADTANLFVIVENGRGGRLRGKWVLRWQRDGKPQKMGLGSTSVTTPDEAKQKAIDARRQIAQGLDPRQERATAARVAAGCPLFGPYATAWAETWVKNVRHRAAKSRVTNAIAEHCKPLHGMTVDKITTQDIIALVLEPLRDRAETLRDVRQRLKRLFDAVIADGHRSDNPADYETKIYPKMGTPKKRASTRGHHKGISYRNLPALAATLADNRSERALAVLILTVARTTAIQHMKWTQLDLDGSADHEHTDGGALWEINATDIPADSEGGEGTKNDCDQITPLPRQAVALLREMETAKVSEYVFPGRDDPDTPMSNAAMLKRVKELTGDPKMTVHGLRGTFRTWAQDETEFDRETVEHCMHHIIGDAAETAYKHGKAIKKRRKVLQAWADYVLTPPKENVVPLRSAA